MEFYDAVTEFIFVEDQPQKADILFVPGGLYPDAAEKAAQLYLDGYAPYILPSGKYSIKDKSFMQPPGEPELFETECDYLSAVLERAGVPKSAVLREPEAAMTWQNAVYSRKKTDEAGLVIRRAILCCQAFHARRSLMYYQEQFPEAEILVCPVVTRGISRENWQCSREGIDTVLGEVERIGRQFRDILKPALENSGGRDD